MKIKRIICVLLFAAFWTGTLGLIQRLVTPKYQTGVVEGSMVAEYYDDPSGHDVVMIGDCEVYENISTVELWKKYGITSYIRGSAQQLVWQSYYLLEDTLRYETPQVVIFNVLALKYDEPQSEAYNRMTLDGMRWSSAKIGAIRASMTGDEHFADYLFPLLRYHSRWSELTSDDFVHLFSKDKVTHNGYYMRVDVRPQEEFPDPMPLTDYTLGANAMDYLQRMTDLCREKGIRLVLMKAPTEYPHWYDEWDAQVRDFADQNGLDYLNFLNLREDMGLDLSTDTYDAGLHLNLSGAEKMADYLGGWLAGNCGLADHRTEEKYREIWREKVDFYEEMKQSQYRELEQYGKLISRAPVETKETNVLKNLIVFACLAAVCVMLAACGGQETDPSDAGGSSGGGKITTNAISGPGDIPSPKTDGYLFKKSGVDVALDAPMAAIVQALGEPTKYFESESCAYQGLDKVYTYGGAVIRTYPLDGVDYVLSVELRDDTVSTAEGVCVGDSRDRVTQVYQNQNQTPASSDSTWVRYAKGGCILTFYFGENGVNSITYTKDSGS